MAAVVFAPDALIRFKSGRIMIHTTSSALPAFECDNPMLIGWLCRFARPTDPVEAAAGLQPADREAVRKVLDYLSRSGALIAAAAAAPANLDDTQQRIRQHLKYLARSIYDAACDLHGLGNYAEEEMTRRTGVGVERRLMALLAATDGLRSELNGIRATHQAAQLKKLGIGAASRGLKLHIGCGKGILPGWINIDIHPAPLAMNILSGLPFANGSAQQVFVSHLLEHLFFPRDVDPFLSELRRVVAPGGVIRVVVPDMEQSIKAYVANDRTFFESRRDTWSWWPKDATRLEDFLAYGGAGAEPAYLFESHKYGYDFETLQRVLERAGFVNVIRSGYMTSEHETLRIDDISDVANGRYGERHYSLFVEATAPA